MSIFDQYQSLSANTLFPPAGDRRPISSGYVQATLQGELPMFTRQKLQIRPPADITHLRVCSGFLVMSMNNGVLLRANLLNPDSPLEEMELAKQPDMAKSAADDRLHRLFLDPTGNHVIVCMQSQDNFYLHRLSKKLRLLSKFKGMHIDSVAWNPEDATLYNTGAILIGTSKGQLWETKLEGAEERFFQNVDQYTNKLFDLGIDRPVSISGVYFGKRIVKGAENKYFVLVVTPRRLYEFTGTVRSSETPLYAGIFETYRDLPEEYVDMPGESGYAELHIYRPLPKDPAVSFAWMCSPGAYCGRIDTTRRFITESTDSVRYNPKLIQYHQEQEEKEDVALAASSGRASSEPPQRICPPLTISLTEFHVAMLFADRLKIVCVLNEQVIHEEKVTDTMGGQLRGVWRDEQLGFLWTFTDRAIFKYTVNNESRDVWKTYMNLKDFTHARAYCRDNEEKLDAVRVHEAEYLFQQRKYEESAEVYASALAPSFEEVTLKFIDIKQDAALKRYLQKKLEALNAEREPLQVALLVTWLIEIWLTQLSRQRHIGWQDMDACGAPPVSSVAGSSTARDHARDQAEFRMLLSSPKLASCLRQNRTLIYSLIASHGDVDDMIYFADLMADHEKVISHKIQMDRLTEALDDLSTLKSDIAAELVYRFSPILMQSIPKATVKLWIKMGRQLDPRRLMPALVQYESSQPKAGVLALMRNEAIDYLDHCITNLKNRDLIIHNFLLSLYAKYCPDKLMLYLESQEKDEQGVCFDIEYALRLCCDPNRADLRKACVHVYSMMGLYEEAVQLALQEDIELAKENARKPEDDEDKKKLWLQIAKHVVSKQEDIEQAMEVLRESNLLKVEDILPFFPDFETIDHFKDAICKSLKEFNEHISSLKQEMEEATHSADDIRQSIQKCRNKCAYVITSERCAICSFPLLTRGFYLFPCGHKFHADCLMTEVIPNLLPSKRGHVDDLRRMLDDVYSTSSATSGSLPADSAKAELDEIIAAECIYCGEIMIRSIDQPLVSSVGLSSGWD